MLKLLDLWGLEIGLWVSLYDRISWMKQGCHWEGLGTFTASIHHAKKRASPHLWPQGPGQSLLSVPTTRSPYLLRLEHSGYSDHSFLPLLRAHVQRPVAWRYYFTSPLGVHTKTLLGAILQPSIRVGSSGPVACDLMTGNVLEPRIDHEAGDTEIVTYGTPREDSQEARGPSPPPLTPTPHPLNLSKQTQRLLPPSTLSYHIFRFSSSFSWCLLPTSAYFRRERKKKKNTLKIKTTTPPK